MPCEDGLSLIQVVGVQLVCVEKVSDLSQCLVALQQCDWGLRDCVDAVVIFFVTAELLLAS